MLVYQALGGLNVAGNRGVKNGAVLATVLVHSSGEGRFQSQITISRVNVLANQANETASRCGMQ